MVASSTVQRGLLPILVGLLVAIGVVLAKHAMPERVGLAADQLTPEGLAQTSACPSARPPRGHGPPANS
jgi:hypothetical protein